MFEPDRDGYYDITENNKLVIKHRGKDNEKQTYTQFTAQELNLWSGKTKKSPSISHLRTILQNYGIKGILKSTPKHHMINFVKYQIVSHNLSLINQIYWKLVAEKVPYRYIHEYLDKNECAGGSMVKKMNVISCFVYKHEFKMETIKNYTHEHQCDFCYGYIYDIHGEYYLLNIDRVNKPEYNYFMNDAEVNNIFSDDNYGYREHSSEQVSDFHMHKHCFNNLEVLTNYRILDLATNYVIPSMNIPIFDKEFHKIFIFVFGMEYNGNLLEDVCKYIIKIYFISGKWQRERTLIKNYIKIV